MILERTGHHEREDPWIPLGVGVHTGVAFVGSVGSQSGTSDITVLGDTANTAARLSTIAGIGEILISESALLHADLTDTDISEQREQEIKGKSDKVIVNVLAS
jgi:adenylate cyclase